MIFIQSRSNVKIDKQHNTYVLIVGKTVISKQRAILEGEENEKSVYFISLVAADIWGKPKDHSCIFDLLTENEMDGKNVTFLDALSLKKACKVVQEGANVYELVKQFINENREISVIIDECPLLASDPWGSGITLNESINYLNTFI